MPSERAGELNTPGVPSPFDVEYNCLIDETAGLVAAVHKALSANRHTGDRGFFRQSLETAIQPVEQRVLLLEPGDTTQFRHADRQSKLWPFHREVPCGAYKRRRGGRTPICQLEGELEEACYFGCSKSFVFIPG